MANISLDSQEFFYPSTPTSGSPMGQTRCLQGKDPLIATLSSQMTLRKDAQDSQGSPPAPPVVNVIEISSDSESDYDESRSDTSSPQIDELFPPVKSQTKSDTVASTRRDFNYVYSGGGGGRDLREQSIIQTANSKPLPLAAARLGLALKAYHGGSENPPCERPSCGITSSRLQTPVAVDTEPSVLPSSPRILSSPTPLEADSLHDVENLFGGWLAQTTNAAYNSSAQAASHPDKELAGRHESWSDGDAQSITSPREKSPPRTPREGPLYLESTSQGEEWDKRDPLSPQASRSRPLRGTQVAQRRTYSSERLPAAPTEALPRQLPGSVRALQQDEPGPQDRMSSEAEQETPIRETGCGKAATEVAHSKLPEVEASALLTPNHSAAPLQRPNNGIHRESRPTRVSVRRGDRGEQDSQPPVKRNTAHRSTAVRHGIRHRIDSFDITSNSADADGVQEPLAGVVRFPQRRKRRRPNSQREHRLRRRDVEDTDSPAEDSSDEWVARLPKRHRGDSPGVTETTAAARPTVAGSANDRLQQVQTPGGNSASEALSAKLAEWLSETADVRKAEVDGVTTFQLRFYCSTCRPAVLSNPRPDYTSNTPARRHKSTLGHVLSGDVAPDENRLFAPTENNVKSLPLREYEVEWEAEKIVGHRKRGRGWQVRVKWAHFKGSTWQPLKSFLGSDVLLAYEAQHGQVAL